MKKFIFTIVFMLGMSATALADSVIFLEHKGNMTTFKAENINDALEAAADGDVLYLSEGTYPGFTIAKQISIKGVGQQTVIDGDIEINNSDKVKLTGIFIGYLDMKDLIVKSPVSGLRVAQCKIYSTSFNAISEELHLDRCIIARLVVGKTYSQTITLDGISKKYTYPYIKGLTITNSVVSLYSQTEYVYSNVSLVNCFIGNIDSPSTYGDCYLCGTIFVNSIICGSWLSGCSNKKIEYQKLTMTNSSIDFAGKDTGDSVITDCYDEKVEDYSVENLSAKGYLGNDGKVIGPYGGNTPYTLVPAVPRVTKSKIMVDPKKQELNAILTVSPQ